MRVVAYCRVSTEKEEQMESLENQKSFFEEYARRQGFQLVKIYADEGISGKQMKNREQFLRMLEDSKKDLFDMVAVKDISRFARNTVDLLNSIRQLRSRGIEVQFLSNHQTILTGSEFVLTIFGAQAQEESRNLSDRVKFGLEVSAKRGKVPTIIYGYNQIGSHSLEIREEEAAVVRKIFDWYGNKGLGVRKIAEQLTGEGIPAKKGGSWSAKTVRRILENPIYNGKLVNHKYETVDFMTGQKRKRNVKENYIHERPEYRIVSRELFQRAQEVMEERRKKYFLDSENRRERYSGKYLFSGLIRCGDCGYAFSEYRASYGKTERKVWKCSGRHGKSSRFCGNGTVVEESLLKEKLGEYFQRKLTEYPKFPTAIVEEYQRQKERSSQELPIKDIRAQIVKQEKYLEKHKVMYQNDIITLEELKEKTSEIQTRVQRLKKTLERQEQKKENVCWERLSFENWTNSELRRVVEKIEVKNGCVKVFLQNFQL